jgi:hypothetical protein
VAPEADLQAAQCPPKTRMRTVCGESPAGPISAAIYALPMRLPELASAEDRARSAESGKVKLAQANAFEKGLPSARVVRVPDAGHEIYRTNEADVLREMYALVSRLK